MRDYQFNEHLIRRDLLNKMIIYGKNGGVNQTWALSCLILQPIWQTSEVNVLDVTVISKRLYGEEVSVYGDSGYFGAEKREDAVIRIRRGQKVRYKINRRPAQSKNNTARSKSQIKRRERKKSSIRAKVERVFGIVKGLFGFCKTRYKGRRKQVAKLHMQFALANLILADGRCLTV